MDQEKNENRSNINTNYILESQLSIDSFPIVKEDPLFLNLSEPILEREAEATPILLPEKKMEQGLPAPILFLSFWVRKAPTR